MKRITLFAALLLCIVIQSQAQCGGKGMKAIDAKDYSTAWTAFEDCLKEDASDISANFGMSRLYGMDPSKKDMQKALDHLVLAESGWAKLDEKGRAKYEKLGVTTAELESRRSRIESTFLEAAKTKNTVEAYDGFLLAFPNSVSATVCRNYRNNLAYDLALKEGSVEALDNYLTTYPDAENVADVAKVRDEMATVETLKANTEDAMVNFLKRYPNAIQAPQVQQRLNAVAFENAKAANTVDAFRSYVARFPDSVFITQAKEKLEWLEANSQK
ncbi:MAG TPA: hypothetical protein VHS96_18130 [Bacteroidia bacterium]|nr:hypothetical protein [Bacteroidia bacterium]